MKLARKIAIAVTLVIAIVLGLDGILRVQRQLETFEKDTRRDHLSMGRATAAAITESWLSYGERLATDLVARIGKKTTRVSVRWVSKTQLDTGPRPDGLKSEDAAAVFNGRPVSYIQRFGADKKQMVTFVPIQPRGDVVGAIEITESLANQSRHIRETVRQAVVITLTTILICAAATMLLGFFLIGRPIRMLVQQAQNIGRGNFETRHSFRRRDEISALSREMNTMATELEKAMQQIEYETKAHLKTLEQLRHADRLKTVGQLTSSAVHEVGTPLTVISGRAKMIQTAEAEGDEARDCARIVVEQAEKVTKTVRQILDFARLSTKERRVQDISIVVKQMVSLLTPVAVKSGIYLDYDGEKSEALAHIDANQIQQVLANLIINAIQASQSGEHVTVSIHRKNKASLNMPHEVPADIWALAVKDRGCGIPKASIARIFESFYTTKTSGSGTGLGLAISREIVREHDGWIVVESEPETGSTFTVCLPVAKGKS